MPQPPRYPNVIFFDPNKTDRGLIEYWSTETGDYTPLDLGSPHENTRDYLGFRLGIQQALPDNQAWIKRVWVSDETNPNWFNYELKLASESVTFPTYVRTYRENKKTYTPKAKGIPLDTVIKLTLVNPGTGYTPGTFPALAFSAGAAVGHAIVNLDGTIADLVLDNGGSSYATAPTFTIEAPPSGTTATGTASIQPQSAVLTYEKAELFPKDSEFFGLYFNVTRIYETIPGPTLHSTKVDEDGKIITTSKTRKLISAITDTETVSGNVWTRVSHEDETTLIATEITEARAVPGNAIPFTKLDDDGVSVTGTRTLKDESLITTAESLPSTTWTRTYKDKVTDKVAFEVTEVRTIPGPLQTGEQTGKWGVEPVTKQKIKLPGTIDEGYLVRESKIEPIQGSNLVGEKITVFYPGGLYGVELQGQDYDPRLDTVIPFIQKLQPAVYGIGVNREDITPVDYQHSDVRTIDPATVQAVLDAYVFSYPGRINVDMPDLLTDVYGVIDSSTSDGADQETGTSVLTGTGSIAQTLTAQAQAAANILPEAYPVIKQFWGNNIACSHYHFFLPNPVTLAQVLTKLNTILSPDTILDWPKYNPEIVTLVMTGGRVSVQGKAHSQGSYAFSSGGSASTAAGGVGYSEERGLTVKTLRISPTIHDIITIYGDTYGSESVYASAYAECAGLGPLESQTTGPLSVTASILPTTIPATVGDTAWPTSGFYLYRTDPHPYRYGYIEFHCVVINAADFPNVP
jgi:hypothetical protein